MHLRQLFALVIVSVVGCGGAQRCPAGTHWDECAHGGCPECDDCVEGCAP